MKREGPVTSNAERRRSVRYRRQNRSFNFQSPRSTAGTMDIFTFLLAGRFSCVVEDPVLRLSISLLQSLWILNGSISWISSCV